MFSFLYLLLYCINCEKYALQALQVTAPSAKSACKHALLRTARPYEKHALRISMVIAVLLATHKKNPLN